MQDKLTLYDFLGFIIPGTLCLLLFYWFLISFLSYPISLSLSSIGDSILFLVVSYSMGHIVQSLGNRLEYKLIDKWGGWYSDTILENNNDHYTNEFKTNIKEYIQNRFNLSYDVENEEQQLIRKNEIFNLCYSTILQENMAPHTEIFNGHYGLYRGLLTVSWIGFIIAIITTLKHGVLSILELSGINYDFGYFGKFYIQHLMIGCVFIPLFYLASTIFEKRLKRFSLRFADSVYRNFYAWSCRILT